MGWWRSAGLTGGLLLYGAAATAPAAAQTAAPLAPPGVPADAFPRPSRPVAEIVSPIWDTEVARDKVDEVGQVARAMGLKPGDAVADIGAGSGYYTVRLAQIVGAGGHVYAEDVVPDYMAGLEARVRQLGLGNVTLVRGEAHDPRLPPASVDAAVLVHMYHEIAQPFALLTNLAAALRPGGRVGIVDADAQTWQHGTPPALLRCELAAIGYREVGRRVLKGGVGYLAIFEAPAPDARVAPSAVKPCPVSARR